MFVTGALAYLQLPKTACTHIAMLLSRLCGGQQFAKHSRLPDDLRPRIRFVVGSIRSPWDWYVSLWAFGCAGKGGHYERVTSSRSPKAISPRTLIWRRLYSDVNDPGLFREWLLMLHDPAAREDRPADARDCPATSYCGVLTFRYAQLYSRDLKELYLPEMASPERLLTLLTNGNLLDFAIRVERLEDDLIVALQEYGIKLSVEQVASIHLAKHTNTAFHHQTSYYYDTATRDLVADRDRFIIERYLYSLDLTASVLNRHRPVAQPASR